MVRLKRKNRKNNDGEPAYFHSTMVRLKPGSRWRPWHLWRDFHSTMVRLKPKNTNWQNAFGTTISIPLWCDWNKFRRCWGNLQQFIISIPLWCDWNKSLKSLKSWSPWSHFHSTMVRLKLDVEIYNFLVGEDKFPFHYGAIETPLHLLFLLFLFSPFPFHYGAIETSPTTAIQLCYSRFPFHYGAIETRRGILPAPAPLFHFHSTMVRLKPNVNSGIGAVGDYFHSTMVRLKHKRNLREDKERARFPFHYGAIETMYAAGVLTEEEVYISIPLWCDWNSHIVDM